MFELCAVIWSSSMVAKGSLRIFNCFSITCLVAESELYSAMGTIKD